MIFVTVGTQLPFERLVSAMDDWARRNPDRGVFIQSGETRYRPVNCGFKTFTRPDEWEALFWEAEIVVSHAGMGTILKSLDRGKPLILMPRLAAYGEHRNDHQLATVARFRGFPGLAVVDDAAALDVALAKPPVPGPASLPDENPNLRQLRAAIREFAIG